MLLDSDLWALVVAESARPHRPSASPMPCAVLEDDSSAGLHLVEIGGERYWLPRTMHAAAMEALYAEVFCEDHPHYYEFGGCIVRPGDVVVDAGASEGLFTRFAVRRGARVIAVEPWGPLAESLRRTFAAEIADGTVAVVQATLSDAVGTATLHVNPACPWGASVGRGHAGADLRVDVPQTTLDALVADSPWGSCDFLKVDVEGVERQLVAGAQATLRRDRPCASIAVYHHAIGYLDIRDDLRRLGQDYVVKGKGLQRRGLFFPTILHAWSAGREHSARAARAAAS
jgi:FkbM family methyltransferase